MPTRVLVTGASGVLGSAVFNAFKHSGGFDVTGIAHTRATDGLQVVDLLKRDSMETFIKQTDLGEGDWCIHCAAERRPDLAEKNPEQTQQLNSFVPGLLARLSAERGFKLVYISTDYVFDGTSPPYSPKDRTNPLQLYGKTKRDGELAVLGIKDSKHVVLRVPILYGPAPKNGDSAINILLDVVADQSGKRYTMDHFATRYPTNVLDIANFLVRLTALHRPLPTILHYSAGEPFTKYEICLIFSQLLGLPHDHIVPQSTAPNDGTPRPVNTQLDVRETEALFEHSGSEGLGWNPFEEWWSSHLNVKPA
ncbi:related to vacuolar protein sorting-associated protein VPS5 [Serendipita indica DSM 11827]|uniref:Related to vacuolar protein sorting-associated protein VPS5 n=1 Tax=Serendipita indica (strain DSM 11827) TaxID=1109443 RepID=G4T7N9_SERID|nr:related to vacuolar protein sorting-associated protein VPS5 [Serendipita indica DSM 11827]